MLSHNLTHCPGRRRHYPIFGCCSIPGAPWPDSNNRNPILTGKSLCHWQSGSAWQVFYLAVAVSASVKLPGKTFLMAIAVVCLGCQCFLKAPSAAIGRSKDLADLSEHSAHRRVDIEKSASMNPIPLQPC